MDSLGDVTVGDLGAVRVKLGRGFFLKSFKNGFGKGK
jgi:hypothetical protein